MTAKYLEELESLLVDWEDGTLDAAGVERIRKILRTDSEARAHYVRLQMLKAALKFDDEAGLTSNVDNRSRQTSASSTAQEPHSGESGDRSAAAWRPRSWALAVAVIVICIQAGRLVQLELETRQDTPLQTSGETVAEADPRNNAVEATSQGVALVTRLVDVAWAAGQQPLELGDALPPGRLALDSGYAQVEFFCGATVVLEGPAKLDLQSPLLARVVSGRLRAQVPPAARGFSLEVDDMTVVDLGTEFGLAVSPEGASVQVFDGEVELQHPTQAKRLLTAGDAIHRAIDGSCADTDITPSRFLDIAALESQAQGQRDARYDRWQAWSSRLRRDKRVIAYYAFDQTGGWQRRLDSSVEPSNPELDGAIVGARRVDGRWPSKSGLEFKRPGDRVRVQIPGEFQSLTFACWVKIDSLDRWYNSLFLTDNYNKGEPHWQILDTGQLYFSVRPSGRDEPGPRDFKALSPAFWNADLSGRWIHLAVVYDVEASAITHYLNGQPLSRHDVPEEQMVPTRIGAASIGNWSLPTQPNSEFAIRNLNGSIDEFAIFSAALSADEIKEIHDNGKP
ncbi:MAG: LamG-like jellyroll fold domain-containing protein [Planctomycetota bacterium]|jgi:hypothetical protein